MVRRTIAVVALAAVLANGGWALGGAAWHEADRGPRITDEGPRAGFLSKLALYPASRVADLLDVMGLQFGPGLGAHANVHATRLMQFGAGFAAGPRIGFTGRRFGVVNEAKTELSILPFSWETISRSNAVGAIPSYSSSRDLPQLYTKHRDHWAFGADVTAGVATVSVDVHPTQLPDLVLGFFGIDIAQDDYPRPRLGREKAQLTPQEVAAIRTVVIVPSRVIREPVIRMERASGLDVYYHRLNAERFLGLLGTAAAGGRDERASQQFNAALKRKDFDLFQELLERVANIAATDRNWTIVDVRETLEAYRKHAVDKSWGRQTIRRLPNYPGLARHYKADAVLDVRIWEWGVLRDDPAKLARMHLDCEIKIIRHPANRVALDTHLVSDIREKRGIALDDFGANDGEILVQETRHAIDIIAARLADLLVETQ